MEKMQKNIYKFLIKLDNEIVDKLLSDHKKRALFIYVYLLRWSKNRLLSYITLGDVARLINLPTSTKNLSSIREAVTQLQQMNLINVYTDRYLIQLADVSDSTIIKVNTTLFFEAFEPDSKSFFTLIDTDYIDGLLYQKSEQSLEDMIAILTLLCRQIERKPDVLQIAWYSCNNMSAQLRISPNRYLKLIAEMRTLEIIYYEKAILYHENSKKEHYIYSLYEDRQHVVQAIDTVKKNGSLDIRAKLNTSAISEEDVIEKVVDEESGQIFLAPANGPMYLLLNEIDFEINDASAKILNSFSNKYSPKVCLNTIKTLLGEKIPGTNAYVNLLGVENPTGFIIHKLKKSLFNQ